MSNHYPQVMPERMALAGLIIFTFIFLNITFCLSQNLQPVKWDIQCNPVRQPEAVITLTATMAPGWHIYSQFMEEGGPIPTRFKFQQDDAYRLIGTTTEKGKEVKFYDDIFEMEIIWYEEKVSFLQKIILHEPAATVKGKVVYMTCNNETCISAEHEFSIEVRP